MIRFIKMAGVVVLYLIASFLAVALAHAAYALKDYQSCAVFVVGSLILIHTFANRMVELVKDRSDDF